jgi:hypothetical protein
MGRMIPSFPIASSLEEKEWKSFRNSLDESDRKTFMSIIFHHYKQLERLSKELKRLSE